MNVPSAQNCLLCGGGLDRFLEGLTDDRFAAPGVYAIARCRLCGTEQTVPRPSPAELQELYEKHYNFGGAKTAAGARSVYTRLRERLFRSWLYRLWLRLDGDVSFHLVRGRGRLVDVGCNEGRGLERYRDNGFAPEGLELNRVAAEEARGRGFRVHTVTLDAFAPDEPFDVAVMSNVLEHMPDPRAAIRDLRRILAPHGEAWISLPNADSRYRRLFGRNWINWHVPYHLTHFSPAGLRRLLAEEGFAVTHSRCVTPAPWLALSILAAIYARPGQPTRELRSTFVVAGLMLVLRGLLFPALFLLNQAMRGDCLVVRARKSVEE
ncbi:MAG TPA: class I SAM-dependent methyltransferase [Alphaproteobacteria bacterium]|jgi:SAM-dependent methyltransferase